MVKMLNCPVCKKSYKDNKSLERHCRKPKKSEKHVEHSKIIFNKHNKNDWTECKICGLRRKKLLMHIKLHNIDKKEYERKYGEKSLFSKNYLITLKESGSSKHESFRYKGQNNPFYGKKHSKQTKEQISETIKKDNAKREQHFNVGRKHTEESKRNIALGHTGSKNGMFGKPAAKGASRAIQGYRKDVGHHVRSTLEANYVRYLQYNNIEYEYEREGFQLVNKEGKELHYWPDFYLVDSDEYVETKNYKRAGFDKVAAMKIQYPDIRIRILYQNSDEWKELERKYKELIFLWETGRQNLRKTPKLYI